MVSAFGVSKTRDYPHAVLLKESIPLIIYSRTLMIWIAVNLKNPPFALMAD